MTRTRSNYLLSPITVDPPSVRRLTRPVRQTDRAGLAELMLDAYRGTIDDEGEDFVDALAAVDRSIDHMEPEHSFVVVEDARVVAMACITVFDDLHWVDPIVVASDRKRSGLGRDAVRILLASVASAGATEVGATITDGNVASERLFRGLGFVRTGPWD